MDSYRISVLATGAELLNGRVREANSFYLGQELAKFGYSLAATVVIGDSREQVVAALRYLEGLSDLIIVTGGLGPTGDDVTREAVAEMLAVPLYEDPLARDHIEQFYAARKRRSDPTNFRQALLPQGATMVPNPRGTAPGFWAVSPRGVGVVALPGVPRELVAMYEQSVEPKIRERGRAGTERETLCFFGIPEAQVGSCVEGLTLAPQVEVSYRAHFPVVYLSFKGEISRSLLVEYADQVQSILGADSVYGRGGDLNFASVVHDQLVASGCSIAVAESCTGGLVGALLTERGGASSFFRGGVLAYANEVKEGLLGVPAAELGAVGAVSPEVARSMAVGVRARLATDIGLSVTGIAGPDGGSEQKPVGLFYVGVADAQGSEAFRYLFVSSREMIRIYAAHTALDVVRRRLLGLPQRNVMAGLVAT